MRAGVLLTLLLALAPVTASAETFAPVDRPGPPLSVPKTTLAAALKCHGVSRHAKREAVLLTPGTTVDPDTNFGWNYARAFTRQHRPFCTLRSPGDTMADIQVNGEYVVYAIRQIHTRTHRRVQIVGHSQGGMVPRWALRFWPGTRKLVDDVVGMAASNHGTIVGAPICLANGCAPAIWQQRDTAHFIAALNSGQETFAGVAYTSVFSHFDDVVQPNQDAATGSTALRTGDGARTNVATQDVCPASVADHIAVGTYDPVTYALVIDALDHPGPADPQRIDPAVCTQTTQPGVDPATFATDLATAYGKIGTTLAGYPHVAAEPALKAYAKP